MAVVVTPYCMMTALDYGRLFLMFVATYCGPSRSKMARRVFRNYADNRWSDGRKGTPSASRTATGHAMI